MKIVCSIGPNVKSVAHLDKFIASGMNSMRLNFSHASYGKYKTFINYVRKNNHEIEIIQDLQGSKLRVSSIYENEVKVNFHQEVYFCSEKVYLDHKSDVIPYIPVALDGSFKSLYKADKILMKDGTMEFEILDKNSELDIIKTRVKLGGVIRGRKGINAPGMERSCMELSYKDKQDVKFGLKEGVDVICLSYVSTKEDIISLKKFIKEELNENKVMPRIWAKIECRDGIENLDSILPEVDGIMVGRGDLVSEISLLEVPFVEDIILDKCKKYNKEVIFATYILNSMKFSRKPQLAEIEALFRYIKMKVDGIMLAGEVGVGKYPLEAIKLAHELINKY